MRLRGESEAVGAMQRLERTDMAIFDSEAQVRQIAADVVPCEPQPQGVCIDDFYSHMPTHQYIFVPNGDLWPASSVNSRIAAVAGEDGRLLKASEYLDRYRPVEQMTWAPGEATPLIRDRIIAAGGWIEREGCAAYNLYIPPRIARGDPSKAEPWTDHVRYLFGEAAEHIIRWVAHRVQRPGEKINHALFLGGKQGIGKDTLLQPVKYAVGPWNFVEATPVQMLGRFNGFVKSVILRVNEARDLGDVDRFAFYDHMKVYTAAPPDVIRCDEKNIREHAVLNVCGVVITSNNKGDGLYLPADDRRHFVAWSDLDSRDFTENYWREINGWLANGGTGHVTAFLQDFDLSDFNPKAPPPKTAAFWEIVDANRAPEDAELADVLDAIGRPDAITLMRLEFMSIGSFKEWLQDRRNRRQIPHRLESAGYTPVRNPAAESGLWVIGGKRQTVYAKTTMTVRDRLAAATALTR
jgi:hypothetical protein